MLQDHLGGDVLVGFIQEGAHQGGAERFFQHEETLGEVAVQRPMLVEGFVEYEAIEGLSRPQDLLDPPFLGDTLEDLGGQRIGGLEKIADLFGAGVEDLNHLRPLFGAQPTLPQQAVKGIMAENLHLVVLAQRQFLHLDVRDARLGEQP